MGKTAAVAPERSGASLIEAATRHGLIGQGIPAWSHGVWPVIRGDQVGHEGVFPTKVRKLSQE